MALRTSGTRFRPHCSHAAIATRFQWASFFASRSALRRTTDFTVRTGCIVATPSSMAFWMVKSIFSPEETACTRVTASGDSRSSAECSPISTSTPLCPIFDMRAAYSPPRPLKTAIGSPSRRRSTRAA